MIIQGVIFDFNGTLFWDTEYQNIAWEKFLKSYHIIFSEDEKKEFLHGRNVKDTLEYAFNQNFTQEQIETLSEEKEIIYRNICLQKEMKLAPGAESLIQFLLKNNIKTALATAAGKSNVDFFIENFNLTKYFNKKNIIFNDGTSRGKPYPDLFNKTIKSLNIKNENVIIFEDSVSGIRAAEGANPHKIIIVKSTDENYRNFPYPIITHFDQVDRKIF
ncbi:MAG: HAD family phosphatase [Candidatus Marinimicrobia bacterium]|nr:HAD family phosphatase [Candidatus Neomarinimicrobiota bacterium]